MVLFGIQQFWGSFVGLSGMLLEVGETWNRRSEIKSRFLKSGSFFLSFCDWREKQLSFLVWLESQSFPFWQSLLEDYVIRKLFFALLKKFVVKSFHVLFLVFFSQQHGEDDDDQHHHSTSSLHLWLNRCGIMRWRLLKCFCKFSHFFTRLLGKLSDGNWLRFGMKTCITNKKFSESLCRKKKREKEFIVGVNGENFNRSFEPLSFPESF